jgi:alkanesulfonate monooxygenase SsuD/methylene tetrahydromethanopterin reductase-like flavin-dependent oxidoreductase (luciferase family)
MRFGLHMPNFDEFADPHTLIALARDAEAAGWDGFFLWDHLQFSAPVPVSDPWVLLAGIAANTARLRLGSLVTPVPRRHIGKLAREAVTLDHLSNGRVILGVGIGGEWFKEYSSFGMATEDKLHAAQLDEALALLDALWRGEPVQFDGAHYHVNTRFLPRPVQQPRIPIWVGGVLPHKAPFRRAARWDGAFPIGEYEDPFPTPDDVRSVMSYIARHRTDDTPFDMVLAGETPGDDPGRAAAIVAPYAEAGVTWWLEALNGYRGPLAVARERIRQGPPRLA